MNALLSVRQFVLLVVVLGVGLTACPPPPNAGAPPKKDKLRVVPGPLDARVLLADVVAIARKAGAKKLLPIGTAVVSEGDQLGSFVLIPADRCMLAVARPGASLRDVDLFAFSEKGDVLAADESPSSGASVMVCPPHPRRVYVAARVVNGTGLLALGVMQVPVEAADAVAKAVQVRGRPGQDTGKLSAWPGLETKIRLRRSRLGSSWEDVRRVALPLDPHAYSSVSVRIEAKRCIDVLVVPGDDIVGVEVEVVDRSARVIARARPPARDRGLVLCTAVEQSVTIMVRPRVSRGLAAVVVARSPVGSASELAEHLWVDSTGSLLPLDKAVERHAKATVKLRMSKAKELAAAVAKVGAVVTTATTLKKGCVRYDVIGGPPLGAFVTRLWVKGGTKRAVSRGGQTAPLFACGDGLALQIEVEASDVGGPFVVQERHDDSPPPLLLKHPLAAGRMLARLEEVIGAVDAKSAAGATAIAVRSGKRHVLSRRVPVKTCLEWIVSAGGSVRGIDLRIGERTRSRGEHVLTARSCAGNKPEDVKLILDVVHGSGTLLLLGVKK